MKRSGMPRPTICKVSPDTKLFKDSNVYEDTEPPPGTNILLAVRALSTLSVLLICFLSNSHEEFSVYLFV